MNCEKQILSKAIQNTLNFANNIKMSAAQPIKVGYRDSFPQPAAMVDACWPKKPIGAFLVTRTNDDNVRHCKLTYERISPL